MSKLATRGLGLSLSTVPFPVREVIDREEKAVEVTDSEFWKGWILAMKYLQTIGVTSEKASWVERIGVKKLEGAE